MEVVKTGLKKARRVGTAYFLSLVVWTLLSLMSSWQQYAIDSAAHEKTQFFETFRVFFGNAFVFALLTPPIFYLVRRFPIGLTSPVKGAIKYLLGVVPFLILYTGIRLLFPSVWSVELQKFVPRSFGTMRQLVTVTLADMVTYYLATVITAHAFQYFERVRSQELDESELRSALAASELQALKSQLHPHFLFNTLHGISTLIDTDRRRAKTALLQLSELLRAALQHGGSDLIKLEEENKFIESYLNLEKLRLDTRLELRWGISPETFEVLVPHMIMQPLVENAIIHGIACCREGGWLEISSRRLGDKIEIQIRNSFSGQCKEGLGLGLQNTRSRLRYLYSDQAAFSFGFPYPDVAVATLLFPALTSGKMESNDADPQQNSEIGPQLACG
jgi:two-component system LytT family sensor kinase